MTAQVGSKLTAKQARFVEEYLVELNATQAAIRAGYNENSARQTACENLTKPNIEAAIAKAMAARSERTEITADRVLKELARIGFADMRDYLKWGETGLTLTASEELTEDQARAVAEVTETRSENGGTVKFKLFDKRGALVDIGRHLGMFTDNFNLSGGLTMTHEDALKELE